MPQPDRFDHATLVTMSEEGPSIANVVRDDLLDDGRFDPEDHGSRADEDFPGRAGTGPH